ncbi:unnamed protein product [Microthlaspi erraticum]|uniref:Uncharacterized protein n=1 Tax=Microthlaspi erraticum TaxID=1685480 RepID=A0A6D2JKE4_9BRAS|nr:unnamed protein product [Microthlaspi erraticum]
MDWSRMGPFGMDQRPDFPENLADFKYQSVDENGCHSVEDTMKHYLMEPKHDNVAVDSFLGLGMENMGISSKMEEFSHGFDFNFLPDYGGSDSCSTQDRESGLKLEILEGFLDEVDEVEDIYAPHNLSSIGDHCLPDTQVKKQVSDTDGDPYGLMNLSSESYSSGISGSIGLSEWSKETVPHSEFKNVLDTNSKETLCFCEPGDDKKPLSTFIGSWVGRGKSRKTNSFNTARSRSDCSGGAMSCVSYDFRPRKGPLRKHIHTITENALSDDQLTSSESEDDICVTNTSKSRSDRRKNQRMWTLDEVVKLVNGISHFGVGKWTDIKNLFFRYESHRTPIDIRDKWRNLLKASKHVDGEERKSPARPIPKDILDRVRELASLHLKSLSFVHDSSRSRNISRKKKKRS